MRGKRRQQHITTTNYITMSLEDVEMQYSLPAMLNAFPVLERKHGSQYQGSLTLHTPLEQEVEWDSPTEVRGRRKQQHITTTDYSTMLLEDVGMQHSLPVMFHVFPVLERKHVSQYQGSLTLHTPLEHEVEWDSPTEVRGRRKEQHITTTNYITTSLEDVGMQYSLPVMLNAFPVLGEQTQQSIPRITDTAHTIGA